jgi:NTE family protein
MPNSTQPAARIVTNLRALAIALSLLISGCASYGVIQNVPSSPSASGKSYSLKGWSQGGRSNDLTLNLAFSGGGTRAAAFSYGVLKALRDVSVKIDGRTVRLLDEVDAITSVSGGSFTSAYYGLHGDKIFTDFETDFLRRNVEESLVERLLNPLRWFSTTGRTEWAVEFYEETIFHGATFADMVQPDRPLIVINASDLGYGVRFSFLQEYFDLLCSDLASFPVARAVAASSAVPVVFNPVVVENYSGCEARAREWLEKAKKRAEGDAQMSATLRGLESYLDKEKRKYAHFVDGGITDNLSLRAIFDIIEVAGGAGVYLEKLKRQSPRQVIVIAVNASTDPEPVMDASNKQPSLLETVNAMSDVQLHRYNAATIDLTKQSLTRWAREVSTPQRPVTAYFIQLSFRDVAKPELRRFFNRTPTSFSLTGEQVDRLIEAGGQLLRDNPEFRRLLADLGT